MAMKAENIEKITALYCRLSVEDIKDDKDKKRKGKEDESNSISNHIDFIQFFLNAGQTIVFL